MRTGSTPATNERRPGRFTSRPDRQSPSCDERRSRSLDARADGWQPTAPRPERERQSIPGEPRAAVLTPGPQGTAWGRTCQTCRGRLTPGEAAAPNPRRTRTPEEGHMGCWTKALVGTRVGRSGYPVLLGTRGAAMPAYGQRSLYPISLTYKRNSFSDVSRGFQNGVKQGEWGCSTRRVRTLFDCPPSHRCGA